MKKVICVIDESLHTKFKITCSFNQTNMTEVITKLINQYVSEHEVNQINQLNLIKKENQND